ncbi:MAG: hypothetical protein AAGA75_10330 [Cyanobacteria bacterium P01_E01_bin.6]
MNDQAVESKVERLTDVVERIGESVISTSETVEVLASHIDQMRQQTAHNHNSVMALAEAVRVLASGQQDILVRLDQLVCTLQVLATSDEGTNTPE